MDLILHVGYPKTGTTTLQERHFIALPGYLGRSDLFGQRARSAGLRQILKRAANGQQVDIVAWRDHVVETLGVRRPDRVVISDEALLKHRPRPRGGDGSMGVRPFWGAVPRRGRRVRRGPPPIVEVLREHVVPAWKEHGSVRVLLTLRNQSDWLGSHYAENSHWILGASQADFERQVRRIAASGDAVLDFAAVVDDLREVVGPDQVLVLLLEDMGTEHYWAALSAFVGAGLPDDASASGRSNRRSSVTGWQLRDYDRSAYPLRSVLSRRASGPGKHGQVSMGGFRNPVALEWRRARRRGAGVVMDDELRAVVRARCRDSNARLGQLLGRDLTPLGY